MVEVRGNVQSLFQIHCSLCPHWMVVGCYTLSFLSDVRYHNSLNRVYRRMVTSYHQLELMNKITFHVAPWLMINHFWGAQLQSLSTKTYLDKEEVRGKVRSLYQTHDSPCLRWMVVGCYTLWFLSHVRYHNLLSRLHQRTVTSYHWLDVTNNMPKWSTSGIKLKHSEIEIFH